MGGAAAGNRIAGAATTVQSTEYLVRLDSGRTISVIQAQPSFGIGSRVQVIQSAQRHDAAAGRLTEARPAGSPRA